MVYFSSGFNWIIWHYLQCYVLRKKICCYKGKKKNMHFKHKMLYTVYYTIYIYMFNIQTSMKCFVKKKNNNNIFIGMWPVMRHRRYAHAGCKGMCIFQTLPSDWLLSLTGSAGHAPMLRLVVLHVPKCRQAVLKAVPDRDYCSDSTLAENERRSERGRGESERDRGRERERESFLPVRRVHICTMASDPGLLPLLVWTISMQVLGSRGTSNNEGKCGCVCIIWTGIYVVLLSDDRVIYIGRPGLVVTGGSCHKLTIWFWV